MAASTSTHSLSFEKLRTLYRSAEDIVTLTLPARPSQTNPNQYLDSALSMLSESAVSLYGNQHYLESRFDEIETQLGKTNQKLDKTDQKVDKHFDYLNRRMDKGFEDVDRRFDKMERRFEKVDQRFEEVDQRFKEMQSQIDQRFEEARAINFNGLTKSLHAHIRKVAASVQDENGRIRYEVARGFPKTIKRFWLLQRDIKTLISLAKHYSIEGWEDWQNIDEEDSDATQYLRLEYAVVAHPELCLRALAATWGLEYEQLERIHKEPEETQPTARKRKADDETEPRRVKPKTTSDCEVEISISSTENREVIVRRKIIKSEPEVNVPGSMTLEEVTAQYHMPGHSPMPGEADEVVWGSSSSARVARHAFMAAMGASPPTPDKKRTVPRVGTVVDEKP